MLKIKLFLFLAIFAVTGFTVFAQTESWRQYSSTMAGYTVKYPSDWRVEKEEAKGKVWNLIINSPGQLDEDVWEHNSIIICSKPKGETFETLDRCADHHNVFRDVKNISEKTINSNGLQIRRVEFQSDLYRTSILLSATFSSADRDFRITGVFRKIFNLDRFVPVFDEVLKTFQSLKEKTVLTYKNESYDFALTYPISWKSCPLTKNDKDEEDLLILVPEGRNCNGGNYILVTRMTKFSNEKNNRDLKSFLNEKTFDKITSYLEFGNIHAAMGEKTDKNYNFRERYFYTNYPQTYELLRITEMYDLSSESYQKEAAEILATARRFLKFQ